MLVIVRMAVVVLVIVLVVVAVRAMTGVVLMAMIVPMIMMVVVMVMIVTVMMVAGRCGIGPTLGLERRFDGHDLCAKAFQQRLDGGVALEANLPVQHLHRNVAVAEMPGEPGKARKVGRPRFDQRFGLGNDLNQVAVVEEQCIVGAKAYRVGELEFDAGAFDAEQEALLRRALGIGQDQGVDDGLIPPLCRSKNACGARHAAGNPLEPLRGQFNRAGRSSSEGAGGGTASSVGGAGAACAAALSASLRWYSL